MGVELVLIRAATSIVNLELVRPTRAVVHLKLLRPRCRPIVDLEGLRRHASASPIHVLGAGVQLSLRLIAQVNELRLLHVALLLRASLPRLCWPHHVAHVGAWRLVQVVGSRDGLLLLAALVSREGAVVSLRRPLLAAGAMGLTHV